MISAFLALALAAEPAGDDEALHYRCPGVMKSSDDDIAIPGVTTLDFTQDGGQLAYPLGAKRTLTKVVRTEKTITAEYKILITSYRLELDRQSGDVSVKSGIRLFERVFFHGKCEPAANP